MRGRAMHTAQLSLSSAAMPNRSRTRYVLDAPKTERRENLQRLHKRGDRAAGQRVRNITEAWRGRNFTIAFRTRALHFGLVEGRSLSCFVDKLGESGWICADA